MTNYATRWSGATPMNLDVTMRSTTPAKAGLANAGLGFERPVPDGGYRWWYIDGFSDCGRFGMTIIGFIGSVFSPYYYRARHHGNATATNHVSLNVILYGPEKSRWCMTERGAGALEQAPDQLNIGPSALRSTTEGLVIDIAERATPFGQRVAGQVKLAFDRPTESCFELDAAGDHWWWPIAPIARIDVAMDRPDLQWSGPAYLDSNFGARPVETGFHSWNWCRGHGPTGDCQIHYNTQLRAGGEKCLSLSIDEWGRIERVDSPDLQQLPRGPVWRVARPARLPGAVVGSLTTLEDTPFYTRSQIHTADGHFMHESLDLTRFCQPWVQLLLPFRMPRRR